MTPIELKPILESVLRDGLSFPSLLVAITLILSILTSFLLAYAAQRGASRAINENFQTLRDHQKEMTRETEEIRASIARLLGEQGVRFAHLHAKVFDSTAMLYTLLWRAHLSLNEYIHSRMKNDKEQLFATSKTLTELRHCFLDNEIYFDDDVVQLMTQLLSEMRETFNIVWGSELQTDFDSPLNDAIRKMMENIEPIRLQLKALIRSQMRLTRDVLSSP